MRFIVLCLVLSVAAGASQNQQVRRRRRSRRSLVLVEDVAVTSLLENSSNSRSQSKALPVEELGIDTETALIFQRLLQTDSSMVDRVTAVPSSSPQSSIDPPFSEPAPATLDSLLVGDWSTMGDAVKTASLDLEAPLTLLAPTNAAFAQVDETLLVKLFQPSHIAHLRLLLQLHVVPEALHSTDLKGDFIYVTLAEGYNLVSTYTDGVIALQGPVNSAKIDASREQAFDKGIFLPLDTVLLPSALQQDVLQTAQLNPQLTTFRQLVTRAGLETNLLDVKQECTVLAPTNKAFETAPEYVSALLRDADDDLIRKVLLYHILWGVHPSDELIAIDSETTLVTKYDNTTVVVSIKDKTDVIWTAGTTTGSIVRANGVAANGLLHAIDGVLLPLDLLVPSTPAPVDVSSIAALLSSKEDLSKTASRILNQTTTADLADATAGPFTVLAPNNEAWSSGETVAAVIPIIQGAILSTSVTEGMVLTTLDNVELTVRVDGGAVVVEGPANSANVVEVDMIAENGVIHTLDTVLLLE